MKMEKAAKTYKARFVMNISELGEDDPLTQNVRPWLVNSMWEALLLFVI